MARTPKSPAAAFFAENSRWRWFEIACWLVILASAFVFPNRLQLLTEILIMGLFALSFGLLLGYAGIPSLGHAAFFGTGAYATGILSAYGWGEPLTGLLVAAAAGGLLGLICSLVVSRLSGGALLMVTLGIGFLLLEVARRLREYTGGDDGLQGVSTWPLLGIFPFDFYGRTAFVYVFIVSLLAYLLIRRVVHSPFGLELRGMRENLRRVPAIGISIRHRYMVAFTLSAAIAGLAGGLVAETQSVSLEVLGFDRSAGVLIAVMLGGIGTMIGPLIGAAIYTVAQNYLSELSPLYWNFWLGLMLVLIVLLAEDGIVGRLEWLGRKLKLGGGAPR